ncbi:hypothetical protein INT45_009466 [Circinella minor]|uniref:Fungal lipase-type domain-containing protein n=1 Tax=Circinella minor TaxID=1195481 RepID=A0A8H7RUD6_9FUNG|nr:hypothetical protein INT45_009466 [Circinella minor]
MKLTSPSIILTLIYFLFPTIVAHPVINNIKKQDNKTIAVENSERPALKNSDSVYDGIEQHGDMALKINLFFDSDEDAVSSSRRTDVRQATQSEIDEHIFYTKLSATAYCRTVIPLGKWNCKHCDKSLKMIKTFSSPIDDTNAMILRGDQQKTIYIVFRGFLHSYNDVRDALLETLNVQARKYPNYKVAVTGDSMGGALAVLHGLDLLNYNRTRYYTKNLQVFTQGQPRVGNLKFAKYALSTNISINRLTNKRDLFPHLPSSPPYFHVGKEYWITGDIAGTIRVCPNGLESPYCGNSIFPFTNFLDHYYYLGINVGLCL